MASRLELHEELCKLLGSRNVYFQPPESIKMKYPCIVYSKAKPDVEHADNKIYKNINQYDGVVIDLDPDSEIPNKIVYYFHMCSLDRGYTKDNLNHSPFTLYY